MGSGNEVEEFRRSLRDSLAVRLLQGGVDVIQIVVGARNDLQPVRGAAGDEDAAKNSNSERSSFPGLGHVLSSS